MDRFLVAGKLGNVAAFADRLGPVSRPVRRRRSQDNLFQMWTRKCFVRDVASSRKIFDCKRRECEHQAKRSNGVTPATIALTWIRRASRTNRGSDICFIEARSTMLTRRHSGSLKDRLAKRIDELLPWKRKCL
jgi:hypothetical protein